MSTQADVVTASQYLKEERQREERFEFENGKMIPMGGGSKAHNQICINIAGMLWNLIRQQPTKETWSVYQSEFRVYTGFNQKYYYPDIVITQGKEEFLDDEFDTLTNPHALIEVLSDSTEKKDRTTKFEAYRHIPSCKEYILISQYGVHLESFYKNEAGEWIICEPISDIEQEFSFRYAPFTLPIKDIYYKVKLDA